MAQMGQKELEIELQSPISDIPAALSDYDLSIGADLQSLIYRYDTTASRTGITTLLGDMAQAGLVMRDVATRQSSLEDIFVGLVEGAR